MSLLDVSQLRRQADLWHEQLPRVEPFYAVKCNSHPEVLAALWGIWQERGLGGFDAASPFEMQSVIDLGADPAAKVIYAHPCKQASAVTWARGSGVRRTTFDTSEELLKLRELWPEAELVLRMQTDDSLAQCPLSNKFGCAPEDCAELLAQAKALGMKVVGVSFHVGSGCSQVGAFRSALKRARRAFDEAEQQGFTPKLLDIGGGFPGWDEEGHASFADHAADIREMLEELFPSPEIQVIAEPGRFFAAKASSVLTTVVCVKEGSSGSRYYLNDGVYGSFNCLIFDHAELPRPRILRAGRAISEEEAGACQACTIFGPTCDGFDKLSDTMALPQLRVGDRLLFENFGAYTAAASTYFNGFEPAASFVFSSSSSPSSPLAFSRACSCSSKASWESDVDLCTLASPMGLEILEEKEKRVKPIFYSSETSTAASATFEEPTSTVRAARTPVHVVETSEASLAHVSAAEAFLGAGHSFGVPQKDLPMSLLDVSQLRRQADLWHEQLPRVEPFYAVKCNSHPEVLAALWGIWQERGLGGFDAASPFEMQSVIDLGADPAAKVIYAHPCKQASAVTWARGSGVRRTTFDTSEELLKLRELWPEAELVLRMQTDDSLAQCPLSNKFGCAPEDCAELLAQAKALGMKVVGVSFHVGSGCSQVGAFRSALKRARRAFDEAEQQGFTPKLLDIGGGFPGWDEEGHASFADHAADIREMLEELFPSPEIQVIAEPGRFFAAKASSVLTTVVCVKEGSSGSRYYLNDGVYGSFNCLIFDHAELPRPRILRAGRAISEEEAGACQACTIFGPTCDGFDKLSDTMALPQLRVGDRLLFENFGAYTAAASTYFNGFEPAASFVFSGLIR